MRKLQVWPQRFQVVASDSMKAFGNTSPSQSSFICWPGLAALSGLASVAVIGNLLRV
jgi:hypothetical protein